MANSSDCWVSISVFFGFLSPKTGREPEPWNLLLVCKARVGERSCLYGDLFAISLWRLFLANLQKYQAHSTQRTGNRARKNNVFVTNRIFAIAKQTFLQAELCQILAQEFGKIRVSCGIWVHLIGAC
jgi:hypothetical protein